MREARYRISRKNLIMDIDYEQLAAQIRAGEVMALFCRNDRLAVKTIRSLRRTGRGGCGFRRGPGATMGGGRADNHSG